MKLLALLLNPGSFALLILLASVVWMLKDEKDKSRPIVVFAIALDLILAWLFPTVLGGENSFFPWKYDHILARLDESLGVSAAAIALPLQGALKVPLQAVYQMIILMLICWFLVNRSQSRRVSLVIAYVIEMIAAPILYATVPACGPIYAFGPLWLHPPAVIPTEIRLTGMPNAFPSLHIAAAFALVLLAPGKLWRGVSLAFLAGTVLATLSTGEHYVIDLIPGLALGCFAVTAGCGKVRSALAYLGAVLAWSLSVRFGCLFLIAHPSLLRTCAILTVALAAFAVFKEWSSPAMAAAEPAAIAQE